MASLSDIVIISVLALGGIEMHALSVAIAVSVLGAAVLFGLLLDFVKVPVFRRLGDLLNNPRSRTQNRRAWCEPIATSLLRWPRSAIAPPARTELLLRNQKVGYDHTVGPSC